jgi:hypothetical protein
LSDYRPVAPLSQIRRNVNFHALYGRAQETLLSP